LSARPILGSGSACLSPAIDASPRRFLFSVLAMLGLAIGLPLLAALLHESSPQSAPRPERALTPAALVRETPLIADRVSELRGLAFKTVPRPRVVPTASLGRILTRDYRRPRVKAQNREDQTVLELLGLLGSGDDLQRTLEGSADIVAGAYDPASRKLYLVGDATLSNRAVAEITLAHELTHALEDQVYGLPDPEQVTGDRALAVQAFLEGSATALMTDYATAYISVTDLLGVVNDPAITGDKSFGALPRVLREQLLFTYLKGQRLIEALRRAGGGDWNLVDIGYRSHLPRSTEQVLHPLAYLRDEPPLPVSLSGTGSPGPGWRPSGSETLGELETSELLAEGNSASAARKAAAGWGGDRLRLWHRRSAKAGCTSSCRRDAVLLVRWRWDTVADATQFAAAARKYLGKGLGGKPSGSAAWRLRGGAVALAATHSVTTLAFAPTPALAERITGPQR